MTGPLRRPAEELRAPPPNFGAGFGLATVLHQGEPRVVVLRGDHICPLSAVLGSPAPSTVRALLGTWDVTCDAIADALVSPELCWSSAAGARFLVPIVDPPTIYCAGANYRDHVAEMGRDLGSETIPFHFLLPPSSTIGHGQPVALPAAAAAKLDWEVELVAVIGRLTDRVTPAQALAAVAGYTIANDVTVRDWGPSGRHPLFGHRWLERKGRATHLPIGPALVPARFVSDPMSLALSLEVNRDVRQSSNTSEMIFSVAEQIAHLSTLTPLLAGDHILTGTPAGTAAVHDRYLAAGDRMTARIQCLGALANEVRAADR